LNNYLIDAHCHLNKQELLNDEQLLSFWNTHNFSLFINSVINKSDLIIKHNKLQIRHIAGLHPYLFFEKKQDFDLEDLFYMASNGDIIGIGECGLDKRFNNINDQISLFKEQVAIALEFNLPIVIHCVGKYYEIAKIIKDNFPKALILLHGFTGNKEIIQLFNKLNTYYSISFRLFNKHLNIETLLNILKTEQYVFETDIELNTFTDIDDVISKYQQVNHFINYLSEFQNIDKILSIQSKSIKSIFNIL